MGEGQLREGGSPPLPTITSHTHHFTVCLFHITCRTAVSDIDMGKRHAVGVPPERGRAESGEDEDESPLPKKALSLKKKRPKE